MSDFKKDEKVWYLTTRDPKYRDAVELYGQFNADEIFIECRPYEVRFIDNNDYYKTREEVVQAIITHLRKD